MPSYYEEHEVEPATWERWQAEWAAEDAATDMPPTVFPTDEQVRADWNQAFPGQPMPF